ncbi:MAG: methenyltetrahydromethanopterin cyclohydrolase [Candidatus Thorarchaeota archaeon]
MHHSVNQGSLEIVKEILDRKDELICSVKEMKSGTTLIDAGIQCKGSVELGRLIGETCLGGLGAVRITRMIIGDLDLPAVIVSVERPKIGTLASQYAGWSIRIGENYALGSGPARALARVEKSLYEEIGYQDTSRKSVIVLETRDMPTEEVVEHIAKKCGIPSSNLYCIVVPTASIAGSVQISSRIVGVGLHKLRYIGFDLERIRRGHGVAPIAPVEKHDNKAMGVTNDCIRYGGRTFYHISTDSDDLQEIVERIPASTSTHYEQSFNDLFKSASFDFYKLDPLIFGPAEVTFNHIESGKIYQAGGVNPDILRHSFGI